MLVYFLTLYRDLNSIPSFQIPGHIDQNEEFLSLVTKIRPEMKKPRLGTKKTRLGTKNNG